MSSWLAIVCDGRSPDAAKIKDKMVFASSKDVLRRALVGVPVDIQASDFSDVAKETGTSVRSHSPSNRCLTGTAVIAKAKRTGN